jgi:hypothetical protein
LRGFPAPRTIVGTPDQFVFRSGKQICLKHLNRACGLDVRFRFGGHSDPDARGAPGADRVHRRARIIWRSEVEAAFVLIDRKSVV